MNKSTDHHSHDQKAMKFAKRDEHKIIPKRSGITLDTLLHRRTRDLRKLQGAKHQQQN